MTQEFGRQIVGGILLASCAVPALANGAAQAPGCGPDVDLRRRAVFLQLDVPPGNQVLAFARDATGQLCAQGGYETGGQAGAFGVLIAGQNSVIVQDDYLFVANAGSSSGFGGAGSVSAMRIEPDRLVLTDTVSTEGPEPRSVTRHGEWVYVVNGGVGPDLPGNPISASVQGFRFDEAIGKLNPLDGSHRATIDPVGDPAQIEFTPDGQSLVIAQRHADPAQPASRYLEVMRIDAQGIPESAARYDVGGDNPFGFRIDAEGTIYLTHGQQVDGVASGVSSHRIGPDGSFSTRTSFTVDGAEETCWNYISRSTRKRYMYTSAYFDSAIGQWEIQDDGTLTKIDAHLASSAPSGQQRFLVDAGGLDISGAIESGDTEYLYVLNDPLPQPLALPIARIAGFAVRPEDGTLQPLGEVAQGIPNTAHGLWAQ